MTYHTLTSKNGLKIHKKNRFRLMISAGPLSLLNKDLKISLYLGFLGFLVFLGSINKSENRDSVNVHFIGLYPTFKVKDKVGLKRL
jgi:hypothetical protein